MKGYMSSIVFGDPLVCLEGKNVSHPLAIPSGAGAHDGLGSLSAPLPHSGSAALPCPTGTTQTNGNRNFLPPPGCDESP